MSRGANSKRAGRIVALAVVLAGIAAGVALAAPTVTITSAPIGLTNSDTHTFEFTTTEAGAAECSTDAGEPPVGANFVPCDSLTSHSVSGLGDGTWTFFVRAIGDTETALDSETFTVDTTPPNLTIDSGPADQSTTGNPSPTFGFTATGASAVTCSLDQGAAAFGDCTTPTSHTPDPPLGAGEWTFRVRATDAAANTTTQTRTFTVDTAPPSIAINGGPDGPTNDPTPTFTFATGAGATVECSVEEGAPAFGPCDSNTSHTPAALDDGSYTFAVRATDGVGNVSEPAIREFSVDTAGPTLTIDSGPLGPTADSSPTFGFTREAGSTVRCSVDQGSASFGPCTSGATHSAGTLADGSWTFRVRATDAATNTTTLTRSFSVDVTLPSITINSGPSGPTNEPAPTFGFTPESGTTPECSIDQGTPSFGACTTGTTHAAGTLAEGTWTFRVRVTDAADNTVTLTQEFTVDMTGPPVAIEGPSRTGERRPAFGLSSPEIGVSFRCKLDAKPPVRCGSAFTPGGKLKPGRHKLVVTALDALDNAGVPETFRFKILRPRLKSGRAQNTVAKALRSHGFAGRVMKNLDESCRRTSRYTFSCRFTSAFAGYRLKGRGKVTLAKSGLSYRFKVRAQGQRMTLTDENTARVRAP